MFGVSLAATFLAGSGVKDEVTTNLLVGGCGADDSAGGNDPDVILPIREFLGLAGTELATVFELDLRTSADRSKLRQVILALRSGTDVAVAPESVTWQGRKYECNSSVILPLLRSDLQGAPSLSAVARAACERVSVAAKIPFVLRSLILEDDQMFAYRAVCEMYEKLNQLMAQDILDEAHEYKLHTKRALGERIEEGMDKINLELIANGRYSPEIHLAVIELLPRMLEEAHARVMRIDHGDFFFQLAELTAGYPYAVALLLEEYFHLLAQEGPCDTVDTEYNMIFHIDGAPVYNNWDLLEILSREVAHIDQSHSALLSRLAVIAMHSEPEVVRVLVIGTGSGRLAREIARSYPQRFEIIETDPGPVQICRSFQENVRCGLDGVIQGLPQDAGKLSMIRDSSIDLIVSFGALRYYWDKRKHASVRELTRVLKSTGLVLIGDVQRFDLRQSMIAVYEGALRRAGFGTAVHRTLVPVARVTTMYNLYCQYSSSQQRDYNQLYRKVIDEIAQREGRTYLHTLVSRAGSKPGHVRLIIAGRNPALVQQLRDFEVQDVCLLARKVIKFTCTITEGRDQAFRDRIACVTPDLEEMCCLLRSTSNAMVDKLFALIEAAADYDATHARGFVESVLDLLHRILSEYGAEYVWRMLEWCGNPLSSPRTNAISADPERLLWSFAAAQNIMYAPLLRSEVLSIYDAVEFLKNAGRAWARLGDLAAVRRFTRVRSLGGYLAGNAEIVASVTSLWDAVVGTDEVDVMRLATDLADVESRLVKTLRRFPIRIKEICELGYEDHDENPVVLQLAVINALVKDTMWGGKLETEAVRIQKRKGRRVLIAYIKIEGSRLILGQSVLQDQNNAIFGRLYAVRDAFQHRFGVGRALAQAAINDACERECATYYLIVRESNQPSLAFFRNLKQGISGIAAVKEVVGPNPWRDTEERVVTFTYTLLTKM